MTNKIHKEQKSKVYGFGWTLCEKRADLKISKDWEKVTCKNCLKLKKKGIRTSAKTRRKGESQKRYLERLNRHNKEFWGKNKK